MFLFQDQLDDETLFPSKIGVPFPPNFQVSLAHPSDPDLITPIIIPLMILVTPHYSGHPP